MVRSITLKSYAVIVFCIFSFLAGRLWQLQIKMGSHFSDMSRRNAVRLVTVPAPRGVIYDRNGKPVVTSRMAYRIFLDPRDVKFPDEEYKLLLSILKLPKSELDIRINDPKRRAYEPAVLMADADAITVSRLLEHKLELPGVTVEEFPTRQYIYGEFSSHLLGYLSEINQTELSSPEYADYRMGDLVGKSGVEKIYEHYLRGVEGGLQVEVNSHGEPIRVLGVKNPIPGNDIVLTIDQRLQSVAEKAFDEHTRELRATEAPNADAGAIIAMDPKTGKILAMVSKPGYDPNIFVDRSRRAEVGKLFTDKLRPFNNRAISGEYPYGSTFKMVTATAALQAGKVTLADRFFCRRVDPVFPKKCMGYHGSEDLIKGIQNSCNIVFYELGRRLGPELLSKYARAFGFGEKTGIELPGERSGLVPDKEWKRKVYKMPWYYPESMDFAIGQGFLNGTPLQMATAYCTLVNGGYVMQPQIVDRIVTSDGKVLESFKPKTRWHVPISSENVKIVMEGLEAVVAKGSGRTAFQGFPIKAAGKSGTAQNRGDDHGWFVGYAPADKPEIVVAVLVEQGKSGGRGAGPIARRIMEAYFNIPPGGKIK